jgi:hypothetical protein
VGYIGQGGTATVNNVNGGSGGTKLVSFDYINADFIFAGTSTQTNYPNSRLGYVSVNGGTAVKISFPISGEVPRLRAVAWHVLMLRTGLDDPVPGLHCAAQRIQVWFVQHDHTFQPQRLRTELCSRRSRRLNIEVVQKFPVLAVL